MSSSRSSLGKVNNWGGCFQIATRPSGPLVSTTKVSRSPVQLSTSSTQTHGRDLVKFFVKIFSIVVTLQRYIMYAVNEKSKRESAGVPLTTTNQLPYGKKTLDLDESSLFNKYTWYDWPTTNYHTPFYTPSSYSAWWNTTKQSVHLPWEMIHGPAVSFWSIF